MWEAHSAETRIRTTASFEWSSVSSVSINAIGAPSAGGSPSLEDNVGPKGIQKLEINFRRNSSGSRAGWDRHRMDHHHIRWSGSGGVMQRYTCAAKTGSRWQANLNDQVIHPEMFRIITPVEQRATMILLQDWHCPVVVEPWSSMDGTVIHMELSHQVDMHNPEKAVFWAWIRRQVCTQG